MQFHNITTKVNSRKSATAFGDIPDCWYVLKYQDSKAIWGQIALRLFISEVTLEIVWLVWMRVLKEANKILPHIVWSEAQRKYKDNWDQWF